MACALLPLAPASRLGVAAPAVAAEGDAEGLVAPAPCRGKAAFGGTCGPDLFLPPALPGAALPRRAGRVVRAAARPRDVARAPLPDPPRRV